MRLTLLQALILAGIGPSTVMAEADFSGTITLGSIILGIVVLIAAGFFTIRSNVASVWRQEAEGWKENAKHEAERREAAVAEMQSQLDAEREVRHELKNDLAACQALLSIEKAKPDLSLIIETTRENTANAMQVVTTMFDGVTANQARMLEVLTRLAEKLDGNGG